MNERLKEGKKLIFSIFASAHSMNKCSCRLPSYGTHTRHHILFYLSNELYLIQFAAQRGVHAHCLGYIGKRVHMKWDELQCALLLVLATSAIRIGANSI
jgi:hypothetical protein